MAEPHQVRKVSIPVDDCTHEANKGVEVRNHCSLILFKLARPHALVMSKMIPYYLFFTGLNCQDQICRRSHNGMFNYSTADCTALPL